MNAIAPPPRPAKRRPGTGTLSWHRSTSSWRFRTPGRAGQEFTGFATREEAERALEDALRGIPERRRQRCQTPLVVVRATLRYVIEMADRHDIDVDEELKFLRTTRERKWTP